MLGIGGMARAEISPSASPFSTDAILKEARQKREIGDLSGASVLYQEILDLESNHPAARKELAAVLMEAQVKAQASAPEAETSEATSAILENIKNKKGASKLKKDL